MIGDWHVAGLIKSSVLKPAFTTIEQALVLRLMGRLAPNDAQLLRVLIAEMIG